jgi:hypothetical protein
MSLTRHVLIKKLSYFSGSFLLSLSAMIVSTLHSRRPMTPLNAVTHVVTGRQGLSFWFLFCRHSLNSTQNPHPTCFLKIWCLVYLIYQSKLPLKSRLYFFACVLIVSLDWASSLNLQASSGHNAYTDFSISRICLCCLSLFLYMLKTNLCLSAYVSPRYFVVTHSLFCGFASSFQLYFQRCSTSGMKEAINF